MKLSREERRLLAQFQNECNRVLEETFAQVLTENNLVRLFFINENRAFTDGRNIVVDPAVARAFADQVALQGVEDRMRLSRSISKDPWLALRMMTRGQSIHECLHILYTDFPGEVSRDPRCTGKARSLTLHLIHNIIEDAFIEAAGCSLYDHLEYFLLFHRLAVAFSNFPVEGTVSQVFYEGVQKPDPEAVRPEHNLLEYLNYMGGFLLYPMFKLPEPKEQIADYVKGTKELFLKGSACGKPSDRHAFAQQIFDIIEPLIPDELELPEDSVILKLLPGSKTHGSQAQAILPFTSNGKEVEVTRRLFTDLSHQNPIGRDFSQQSAVVLGGFSEEKEQALSIVQFQARQIEWNQQQLGAGNIHRDITLKETYPKPNLNMKKAYQNIYQRHRININSYNSGFSQLLKARVPFRDERKLFGAGIASRHLADVKKRYWYQLNETWGVPDLAVLLMLDGSGSMHGPRRDSAMVSSVILHEVLRKQGIAHAIVEHRAGLDEPTVDINVLVDFKPRAEEKYNLMGLDAYGDNRDALALYWAEKYLAKHTHSSHRLIIMVADGMPAHAYDEYYPPASSKDTANAAIRIIKRGTQIIAVALDDDPDSEYACYENLKSIYPHTISCTDLSRLTGQLLGIVSKQLR